ncbi:MAG: type II secretion system F family protein [Desulfohalobiaceae bacterium]
MKFSYKALSDAGTKVSGSIEADSLDEAYRILNNRGYIPTRVSRSLMGNNLVEELNVRLAKVSSRELILFTKQFRTLFRAGVSIMDLLSTIEHQTENPKLKRIAARMAEDIKQGATLHEAFSAHPKTFSRLYLAMVRAGETSGALSEVMERLSNLLEHEEKVKNDIRSALLYPSIVLAALVGAFIFLLTFVVPKFVSIFERARIELPWPTLVTMKLNQFVQAYWVWILGAAVLAVAALVMWLRTDTGRLIRDRTLLTMPILGPVFHKAAMSRFASIFAIFQASGISVLESLGVLSQTIGNEAISREFSRIEDQLKQGKGIANPLRRARHFTPMVIHMVAIGEESGNLEEMLWEVANHYDDEVSYSLSRMTTTLGPVLMVGLAVLVGFFALAIFLPIFDLTKMVRQG